jgi:hypothetical protein
VAPRPSGSTSRDQPCPLATRCGRRARKADTTVLPTLRTGLACPRLHCTGLSCPASQSHSGVGPRSKLTLWSSSRDQPRTVNTVATSPLATASSSSAKSSRVTSAMFAQRPAAHADVAGTFVAGEASRDVDRQHDVLRSLRVTLATRAPRHRRKLALINVNRMTCAVVANAADRRHPRASTGALLKLHHADLL